MTGWKEKSASMVAAGAATSATLPERLHKYTANRSAASNAQQGTGHTNWAMTANGVNPNAWHAYIAATQGATSKSKKKRKADQALGNNAGFGALPKPKRPMTAYTFFVSAIRPQVMKSHIGKSFSEIAKIVGELWKQLNEVDRVPYHIKASADKDRYQYEKVCGNCALSFLNLFAYVMLYVVRCDDAVHTVPCAL